MAAAPVYDRAVHRCHGRYLRSDGLTDTTGTVNYATFRRRRDPHRRSHRQYRAIHGRRQHDHRLRRQPARFERHHERRLGGRHDCRRKPEYRRTQELVITGPGNVIVSAAIRDNGGGASALTMAGGGTLVLSGTNTFSGNTLVNSGMLF